MNELIVEIKALQERRKLSDRQFAISIGIDPSTWSYIKNGDNQPGVKVLSSIIRVYPELNTVILNYMTEKVEK